MNRNQPTRVTSAWRGLRCEVLVAGPVLFLSGCAPLSVALEDPGFIGAVGETVVALVTRNYPGVIAGLATASGFFFVASRKRKAAD